MKASSGNWGNLKSKLSKESDPARIKGTNDVTIREKRTDLNQACKGVPIVPVRAENEKKDKNKMEGDHLNQKTKSNYVGLDCEMVGIGLSGKQSALARCCMVDFDGLVIYDKYVRPKGLVTDFRTQWSGIRKKDLRAGEAVTLLECQQNVTALLKDKVLVGHALKNDLDVLMLSHPKKMTRDTATYKPYMRPHGSKGGKFKPRSLKELSKQHLGLVIQSGEHDPGEDARCAMFLYRTKMKEWEDSVKSVRALQAAAFKSKLTAQKDGESNAPSSSDNRATDRGSTTPIAPPPVRTAYTRTLGKESGLSAKEMRNWRRNGTPSHKRKSEEPREEDVNTVRDREREREWGRDKDKGGSSTPAAHTVDKSGSVIATAVLTTSTASHPPTGMRSDSHVDKKRKAVAAPTGMFHNDLPVSTSISDIDRMMNSTLRSNTIGNSQQSSNSKKRKR